MDGRPASRMEFELYGGVNVIGGTKLWVRYGKDVAAFDFGASVRFSVSGAGGFDGSLRPRADREADDYRAAGIVPDRPDLYRGARVPADAAFFISHLHLDHVSLLHLLHPDIPLYISPESARLLDVLERIGEGIGEHTDIRVFSYGEPVRRGELEITAYPVDHDIPGACGFIARSPAGVAAYTGDFRGHGLHPEWTEAYFEALRGVGVDALVCEGTRAGEDPDASTLPEAEVVPAVLAAARPGRPLFFNLYNRNVGRAAQLALAAAREGRTVVLTPETREILRAMAPEEFSAASPAVYVPMGRGPQDFPGGWEESEGQRVSAADIRRDPGRYAVELPYRNLCELGDMGPVAGSPYAHADGPPLGRFDPAYANLQNWLRRFGLEYRPARSSGHASPDFLAACVERADPAVLYATHTLHPEQMPAPPSGVLVVPKLSRTYEVPAPGMDRKSGRPKTRGEEGV